MNYSQLITLSIVIICIMVLIFRWLQKPIGREITTPFKGENPKVKVLSSVMPDESIKFPSKNKRR